MKAEISIRDYQPEGVQALANIYYNTIHRVNIQHYTQEQVDVWAPKSSVENTEGWSKKFSRTKPLLQLSEMKLLDLLSLSQMVILTVFIAIMNGLGRALN